MILQIKLNNILKIIFTYGDTSLPYYLLQLTPLLLSFHIPFSPLHVPLLYFHDHLTVLRWISLYVIPTALFHVCARSCMHSYNAILNERTHIRIHRINSTIDLEREKKEERKKKKKKRTGGEAGMEVVSRVGKLNLGKGAGDTVARTTSGAKFDRAKLEAHVRVSLAPRVHVRCDESRFSYGAKTSSILLRFFFEKFVVRWGFQKIRFLPVPISRPQICKFTHVCVNSLNLFSRIVVVIKDQVRYALEKSNWGR